jgi:hypothetical protein
VDAGGEPAASYELDASCGPDETPDDNIDCAAFAKCEPQ